MSTIKPYVNTGDLVNIRAEAVITNINTSVGTACFYFGKNEYGNWVTSTALIVSDELDMTWKPNMVPARHRMQFGHPVIDNINSHDHKSQLFVVGIPAVYDVFTFKTDDDILINAFVLADDSEEFFHSVFNVSRAEGLAADYLTLTPEKPVFKPKLIKGGKS